MTSIIVILENIRSSHNVGSILRSADGFGVQAVYVCGYTPYPQVPNDTRMPHEYQKVTRDIHKTALGAEKSVPIKIFTGIDDAIAAAKEQGYKIVSIEQSKDSQPLNSYIPYNNIAIVLGNELTGVSDTALKLSSQIIEIPMVGKKESFNVSIAAAICLYALTQKTS